MWAFFYLAAALPGAPRFLVCGTGDVEQDGEIAAMSDVNGYLQGLRERLVADGCTVTHEQLGDRTILVGYKSKIKALSKMHIFTVADTAGQVTEPILRGFTDAAVKLATDRKGQWRGIQSGVIVLPILVGTGADEAAVAVTQKSYSLNMGGFAVMAQPAVVDATTDQAWTFRGTRLWGYAFNALIKKTYQRYLP
jgi:hypothetical protein